VARDAPRSGQIIVGIATGTPARLRNEVPLGDGPLKFLYVEGDHLLAVGRKLTAHHLTTGESLDLLNCPEGWIAGALTTSRDGKARLLMLLKEDGFARLSVLHLSSGQRERLWEAAAIEPLALLPVGDSLTIVHSRGVVRLSETPT
jgi:hypothetical protein